MADNSATTTYFIPVPLDEAVRSLRHVLVEARLKIIGELDLSARLRHRLFVDTPPCLILFIGPATPICNGLSGHSWVVGLTPLHIVISARGLQTEIHVLRIPSPYDGTREKSAMADLWRFSTQISQAIEKIGMCAVLRG